MHDAAVQPTVPGHQLARVVTCEPRNQQSHHELPAAGPDARPARKRRTALNHLGMKAELCLDAARLADWEPRVSGNPPALAPQRARHGSAPESATTTAARPQLRHLHLDRDVRAVDKATCPLHHHHRAQLHQPDEHSPQSLAASPSRCREAADAAGNARPAVPLTWRGGSVTKSRVGSATQPHR